jgi:hypothetical protein
VEEGVELVGLIRETSVIDEGILTPFAFWGLRRNTDRRGFWRRCRKYLMRGTRLR